MMWMDKMRVVITRPRAQAAPFAEALQKIGAEGIFFPTIEIRPVADPICLDRALEKLDCYQWLVLTSANAAEVVLGRMTELGVGAPPQTLRVAAIGPKTAARLEEGGISPDFIPDQYVAEAILPGLGDLRGRWVLLPMADIAHDALPQAIQDVDGIAHVVTAYHTLPAELHPDGLAALRTGVDLITFTSASTARNFCALLDTAGLDPLRLPGQPRIACIGPKTASAARELGFHVGLEASPHTADGLVAAIKSILPTSDSLPQSHD
jgi:uroporphyrinogen-III synthase